jgi:hypothetical protein
LCEDSGGEGELGDLVAQIADFLSLRSDGLAEPGDGLAELSFLVGDLLRLGADPLVEEMMSRASEDVIHILRRDMFSVALKASPVSVFVSFPEWTVGAVARRSGAGPSPGQRLRRRACGLGGK